MVCEFVYKNIIDSENYPKFMFVHVGLLAIMFNDF